MSIRIEKLWLKKYTDNVTKIVSIFDIKVEKKKTSDNNISNLKNVAISENTINQVISIHFNQITIKNKIDCNNIIKAIVAENHKNFPKINSYLFIGLLSIKKIVFHSISLKSSCDQTKSTHTNQNISIIAKPKSTITLLSSQIVSFHKAIENIMKTNAKKSIRYRNLFLTISLNVFKAILNIFFYYIIINVLCWFLIKTIF